MISKPGCVSSIPFSSDRTGSCTTNPLQVKCLRGRVGQLLPILALPTTACKPQAAFRAHDGNRSDASRLSVVRPPPHYRVVGPHKHSVPSEHYLWGVPAGCYPYLPYKRRGL